MLPQLPADPEACDVIGHLAPNGKTHPGPKNACPICRHGGGSLGRPYLKTAAWQALAAAVKRRDRHRCRHADATCKGALSVHHIQRGGADALDNLVTLCRRHHEQAEQAR